MQKTATILNYEHSIERIIKGWRPSSEIIGVCECYYEYILQLSEETKNINHEKYLALYPGIKKAIDKARHPGRKQSNDNPFDEENEFGENASD